MVVTRPSLLSYSWGRKSARTCKGANFLCAVSLEAGGSPRHCQFWGRVALWGGTVPGTVCEPAAFQDPTHWMPQGAPSRGNGQCPPMSASVPGRRTTPGQNSRVELQAAQGEVLPYSHEAPGNRARLQTPGLASSKPVNSIHRLQSMAAEGTN